MFDSLKVIVSKELKRVFSDKRLVFNTFILPPLMLILMYWLMGVGIEKLSSDIEQHQPIVVVNNSPESFKDLLNTMDMDVEYLSEGDLDNIKEDIRIGERDLLVEFPVDFEKKIEDYAESNELPIVNTYYNEAEDYSNAAYYTMIEVLNQYEDLLLGQRLGNINYANVFEVDLGNDEQNLADEEKVEGKMLAMMLPMLLIIFLFASTMGIGADSIAGEKERGTMATLLLTPIKREAIAFGKIISLSIIAFCSAISSFIGILISLPLLLKSVEDSIAVADFVNYGLIDYLLILLVLISVEFLFVCLISIASVIANSVKEANSYMMPIYIVVMIASFTNMYSTGGSSLTEYAIPVYGSIIALKDIFSFQINILGVLISVGVSIAFSLILVCIMKKLFDSEKVMFSS